MDLSLREPSDDNGIVNQAYYLIRAGSFAAFHFGVGLITGHFVDSLFPVYDKNKPLKKQVFELYLQIMVNVIVFYYLLDRLRNIEGVKDLHTNEGSLMSGLSYLYNQKNFKAKVKHINSELINKVQFNFRLNM